MRIIVVIPTFYANTGDLRYHLALETCRQIAQHRLTAIIVDASPANFIKDEMRTKGTLAGHEHVRVVAQSYNGRKGAALREGIALAVQELGDEGGVIAFQEPEKVDMIQQWAFVARLLDEADICVPKRSDSSFRATYPVEQFHSETFANLYLDSLGQQVGFPSIDWTMGPIAFKSSLATHWAAYEGDLWDMQLVPMVRAQRWHGATVVVHEFDFQHPASMKDDESGVAKWSEKRLHQLNFLFEHVGNALKETSDPTIVRMKH
jgi:hypothetical protein